MRDLFSNLLGKAKGFRYHITVNILLKKYKPNREIEFSPAYFNSLTKTIINNRFKLENAFQEILYRIDAWINEGSGWIIEPIESQYINISAYRPLAENSYIDLPIELKGSKKGLINIKNKDQKCFLWCHVRHINLTKKHPGEINKVDRLFANNLSYDGIEFPVKESDFNKIEAQNNICINIFGYENKLVFPIYVSNKKYKDSIDLLLLIRDNKSHYVHIKDFSRFMFHKTKNKNKKWFCRNCLQCFKSEKVLIKHKDDCLSINSTQSVKVEEGIIKYENYFKQLPVSFKIYADVECNLENVEIYEGSCTKIS